MDNIFNNYLDRIYFYFGMMCSSALNDLITNGLYSSRLQSMSPVPFTVITALPKEISISPTYRKLTEKNK